MIVAGYVNRDRLKLKIASVYASVPPKAAPGNAPEPSNTRDLWIVAPWVLSALPECLSQTFEASGTSAYVAARLPAGYERQLSGTRLRYNDCIVITRERDIFVRRRRDKFYIPSLAKLFKRGSSLALIYESRKRAILRIYEPAPPGL